MICTSRRLLSYLVLALALGACSGGSTSQESSAPPPEPLPSGDENERPLLTPEECAAQGGTLVGDIGDGATHRPDFLCPDGAPPIANVPLGIEGSVCCGP